MTEPRRLELAWLFGLYARVIPPPGENGDEMSFAYDGATFTPGELVADSGSRDVEIELTLGGNAITSGTVWMIAMPTSGFTPPIYEDGSGHNLYLYNSGAGDLPLFLGSHSITNERFCLGTFVTAAEGHCKVTVNVGNDDWETAQDCHMVVLLPSGGTVVSDAISIPGYVE